MANRFLANFRVAEACLRESKIRTVLPMLGIAWGVANLVAFLALSDGVKDGILSALGEFGQDIIIVRPGVTSVRVRNYVPGKTISLTPDDAAAIRTRARLTSSLSLEKSAERSYQYGNRSVQAQVSGVEPEYETLRSMRLAAGRFISGHDLRHSRQVVVLGQELAGRLFDADLPVGADIRIAGVRFTVIGVLAQKTTASRFSGPDNQMGFIPFTTIQKLMDDRELSSIVLQPASLDLHASAIREITGILAKRKLFSVTDEEALTIWDFRNTVGLLRGMILGIQGVNALIGLLTLLVAGVGVMNVMLVAVRERTYEIGLRRALGARRSDIACQFLVEALAMTMAAGVAGVLLGAAICQVVPPVPIVLGQAELKPGPGVFFGAFAALVSVGLAAGVLPAIAAARLSPVEALRND